jgi:hypothetical protein
MLRILFSLVEFLGEYPFFLGSRCMAAPGWRTPAIMQHEYRVITLLEVFVNERLRASYTTDRVLPPYRMEVCATIYGIEIREFLELATESAD